MGAKLYPLISGVHLWTDTEDDLVRRLEAYLLKLRERRFHEMLIMTTAEDEPPLPWDDPYMDHVMAPRLEVLPKISRDDQRRIRRRVRELIDRRAGKDGLAHVREADRKRVVPLLAGARLAGPRDEHDADVLAAQLTLEIPWMAEVIRHVWFGALRSARAGLGLHVPPLLIDGPPGIGKTFLARRVAELARVPLVMIDLGKGSEAFSVSGVSKGWSNSSPGRPVEEMLKTGCGNPLVVVDELDKGGVAHGASGFKTSAWDALLGLLEPSTAQAWECPSLRLTFDMSRVSWIMAGNDLRHIPQPLLSRLKIVQARRPTPDEVAGVAVREGQRRGVDPDVVELLAAKLRRSRGDLTMRHLMRALQDLEPGERRVILN